MSKQENPQAADTAIPDHIDPTVARQYPSLAESTVSREVVYEGRFLKVRKDVARMPDGSTNTREFIMHPGAAAMVPIDADGRILIERQFRYGPGRVYVEIPAGKKDPGETQPGDGQARAGGRDGLPCQTLGAPDAHPSGHRLCRRGDGHLPGA